MANEFKKELKEAKKARKKGLVSRIISTTTLLIIAGLFYAYSTSFRVHIFPVTVERYSISTEGGLSVSIGDRILLPFGRTTIVIKAPGFIEERKIISSKIVKKSVEIKLSYAPVNVSLKTKVNLDRPTWIVNDVVLSEEQKPILELKPGDYKISLSSDYHAADERSVSVKPDTSPIINIDAYRKSVHLKIQTKPTNARIFINGELLGYSPLDEILGAGKINLRVEKNGYDPSTEVIDTKNEDETVDRVYLLIRDTQLISAQFNPPAGRLYVNGIYRDLSPEVKIDSTTDSEIRYEADGFEEQTIKVSPSDKEITFDLKPLYGEIDILSFPKSNVFIDGKPAGETPLTTRLLAKQHLVTLKAPNYADDSKKIIIRADQKHRHERNLTTLSENRLLRSQPSIKNSIGIIMNRFTPSAIEIGAPRKQKGQRANEHLRKVDFNRAFYIGKFEITETQYAIFENEVASSARGKYGSNYPVRAISWEEAAFFCNWLSLREGLKPFYRSSQSKIIGFDNSSLGYRLPSEAEWEFVARLAGKKKVTIFVWGDDYNIPANAGNLADSSATGTVKVFFSEYNDGFPGVAPTGSFDAEISGVHDMSGNVSEWVNDFYLLNPPKPDEIYLNYLGEGAGPSHVIKGSSFLSANWTELRPSYKETSNSGRIDVGFRVARYIN